MKTWFTYEDWTLEDIPRCFYVGKGSIIRTKNVIRNVHHRSVVQKYGLNRIIMLATRDEQFALNEEIRRIAKHHTFVYDPSYNGIGVNHTPGGEGNSGNGKPVLKCDSQGNILKEFCSVHDAALAAGTTSLSGLLTGRRKIKDINGFTWKYKNSKHLETKKKYNSRANCKSVIIVDKHNCIVQKYDSIIDAAHALNVHRMIISSILNGKKQVSELTRRNVMWPEGWSIQFEYPRRVDVRIGRKINKKHLIAYSRSMKGVPKSAEAKAKLAMMRSKPVVKRNTSGKIIKTFSSIKAAREAEGCSKSMMINLVHEEKERNGFVWSFLRPEDHKRQGWKHSAKWLK